jgi:hypothetical protein
MWDEEREKKRLIAKYMRLYQELDNQSFSARGGIFTKKTRKRLLGIEGQTGRGRTKYDFWYDVRKYVKTALIDLQLFIELAGKSNIDQVITAESLKPVLYSLVWHPVIHKEEKDMEKAKIAKLLIDVGFGYLSSNMHKHLTEPHRRSIGEAIEVADYLVKTLETDLERKK